MQPIKPILAVRATSISLLLCLAQGANANVEIDHDEIEDAISGERIEVDATVTSGDGDSIREVRTYFRADNDGRWHYVPMRQSSTQFSGLLPAPNIHTDVVRYQLLAITAGRNLVKSEIYNIDIEKDKNTLARLEGKAPRDVKIDVSELQDARDIVEQIENQLDSSERVSYNDRQNIAQEAGEADPSSRVEVRSEYNPLTDSIAGFEDYINLSYVGSPAGYGVAAGVVSSTASVGGAPAAGTVSTAAAASGGGTGWLLGGLALAGGGAAAASSGGGGNDDSSGGTGGPAPTPPGGVTNFAGTAQSGVACPGATGFAEFRWVVELTQMDDQVSGVVAFHDCPGGGRAQYNVTGTATTASSSQFNGTLSSSQGPLSATVPGSQTFTITPNQAPSPNFAP